MRFRGGGIGHKATYERLPCFESDLHALAPTDEEMDEALSFTGEQGMEDESSDENTDDDDDLEEEEEFSDDENLEDGEDEFGVLGFAAL